MVATIDYSDVEVGMKLPEKRLTISRLALLLFGGQTMRLDFAATHWSERIARGAGLPDVIMHGPFTLAKTLEIVNDWTGDPGALLEHHIKLRKPIPVPDDDIGAVIHVSGIVEEKLGNNRVAVELTATTPDDVVLATARAIVRLAAA